MEQVQGFHNNCPRRGCAGDGGAPGAMFQHLCATLLQQSHVCPLPLEAQAVVWAHDGGLRLYPLPDALVLADPAPSTHCAFEGTVCLNPARAAPVTDCCALCLFMPRVLEVRPLMVVVIARRPQR